MIISSDQRTKLNNDLTTSLSFSNVTEEENDDSSLDGADDDIDNYFRCCMIPAAGDSSTFNSQQQTPPTSGPTTDVSCYQLQQNLPTIQTTFKKPTLSVTNKQTSCHSWFF